MLTVVKRCALALLLPFIFAIAFIALPADAEAAELAPEWAGNYGGPSIEYFEGGVALGNGSYVAVGYSEGASTTITGTANWTNKGGEDAIAVCFDKDGKVLWAQNYGGTNRDRFNAIVTDGTYLYAVGYSYGVSTGISGGNWGHNGTAGANIDAILVKIDPATGTALWGKNYGGTSTDDFTAAVVTGGYLYAAGDSYGANTDPPVWGNTGAYDGIVIKIDPSDGTAIWAKNYGGTASDTFTAIKAIGTSLYVAGNSSGPSNVPIWGNSGQSDGIALKIDSVDGTALWGKNYGGAGFDDFYGMATDGTSLYAVGATQGDSTDPAWTHIAPTDLHDGIAVKIDPANGNVTWAKLYGGTNASTQFDDITITGGYLYIAGQSTNVSTNLPAGLNWGNAGSGDALVVKVEPAAGAATWAQNYGGIGAEHFTTIATDGSSFFMVGEAQGASSNIPNHNWGYVGNHDAIAVKISEPHTLAVSSGRDNTGGSPYTAGSIVSISANAVLGNQVFDSWVIDSGEGIFADANSATTNFTMGDLDTVVRATYKATYTFAVTDGTDDLNRSPYPSGTDISITAGTAPTGQEFDEWIIVSGLGTFDDENAASTTFTIGAANTVVRATYKDVYYNFTVIYGTDDIGASPYTYQTDINISADGAPTGQEFNRWIIVSGSGSFDDENAASAIFTIGAEDTEVQATYKNILYSFTVTDGSDDTGAAPYIFETDIDITANTAPIGQEFDRWIIVSGDGSFDDENATSTIFTIGADDTEVQAIYRDVYYDFVVTDGSDDTGTAPYTYQTTIDITAGTAPIGQEFDKWVIVTGSGTFADDAASTTTFTIGAEDTEVQATYKNVLYNLTVIDGADDTDANPYTYQSVIDITADAAPTGMAFDKWVIVTGSGSFANETAITTTFTLGAEDTTVRATYKDVYYDFTVNSGMDNTDKAPYIMGSKISITADPAPDGQVFDKWVVVSGDGSFADATDPTTIFTIGAEDTVIQATYKAAPQPPQPTPPNPPIPPTPPTPPTPPDPRVTPGTGDGLALPLLALAVAFTTGGALLFFTKRKRRIQD